MSQYNTSAYHNFKLFRETKHANIQKHTLHDSHTYINIFIQDMSLTLKRNILNQARMAKSVWEKTSEVMNLFEEGDTKDQVLTVKALKAKPAFKAHYLAPLHTMSEETQVRQ